MWLASRAGPKACGAAQPPSPPSLTPSLQRGREPRAWLRLMAEALAACSSWKPRPAPGPGGGRGVCQACAPKRHSTAQQAVLCCAVLCNTANATANATAVAVAKAAETAAGTAEAGGHRQACAASHKRAPHMQMVCRTDGVLCPVCRWWPKGAACLLSLPPCPCPSGQMPPWSQAAPDPAPHHQCVPRAAHYPAPARAAPLPAPHEPTTA